MSQKVLKDGWVEKFVADYWQYDKQHGRRLARRLQGRVQHAMNVLDCCNVGDEVVFEGSCPSGTTYEGHFVWDGSEEMREQIAQKARRLGGFDAWASWLTRRAG